MKGERNDWREEYKLCAQCHCLVRGHSAAECVAWKDNRPGPAAAPMPARVDLPDPPPLPPGYHPAPPPVPLSQRRP